MYALRHSMDVSVGEKEKPTEQERLIKAAKLV